MKFSELLEKIGASNHSSLAIDPDLDPDITGVAPVQTAQVGTISYVERGRFGAEVNRTAASALILPMDEALQSSAIDRQIAWVSTSEARLLFAKAIALFYQPFQVASGIHPTAVIDLSAQIGEGVSIGAYVVIHADVKIGHEVRIHPNVVIYPEVQIGDRTVLHANCVIHERTQIGADCVIHSGAAIGSEGFGFVPVPEGWVKMEQSGITVLEDGVEVGCNSTIDRPAVGETRVGRNSKIDNLVHIGHGCRIRENCAMAAQVGMAGGVQLGRRVILAGQVGIANLAEIGDGVQVGAQSGVHSDVAPGTVVWGTPAIAYKQALKASAVYNRLPEMHRSLKELQRQLHELQSQINTIENEIQRTDPEA
ncbi:MAG: UDP-3-O-(3-hydroxymyristoyl)glucosamine N-acyltransferase [Cyanobacteria bacterium RU_5_0]|nr:UDP-3-O-(3-hydroxymyristoyl)glucosamine N-acyltransferase [Cyanobacteria bacterium RU_5_0]